MQIMLHVIPSVSEVIDSADEPEVVIFRNYYRCPYDGKAWRDEWSCACNDRCPTCRAEIEPYKSEEIDANGVLL